MDSFKINKIYSDGYERWVQAKDCTSTNNYWFHFIQYDEYLENNEISEKLKIGDIIKGTLKIDLVTKYEIVTTNSQFIQSIDRSSNITAIGQVKKIVDTNILILSVNNLNKNILVEFERDAIVNVGEIIKINGSLEFEVD